MTTDLRYFDYAATTPVDHRIILAMTACMGLDGIYGNAASQSHTIGMNARQRVEHARGQVAALIGAEASEIVWTSGATESNNLALKGFAEAEAARPDARPHIVTSVLEHKAVLDTVAYLARHGHPVTYLTPDATGAITLDALVAAMRPDTGLVSLMLVNNEVGTLTDIAAMADAVHAQGALLHVDAAQALGKTPVDVNALGADFLSISAHKVYGPKGIGALYVRRAAAGRLLTQMHGGGHEQGLRSGTLATHQIVGMGEACELARACFDEDLHRIRALAARMRTALLGLPGVTLNAANAPRIPHTMSITLAWRDFFPFLVSADLAVSSTSACNSAPGAVSHVLTGLGLDPAAAARTIRLSLGRYTRESDIEHAIACMTRVVQQCRQAQQSLSQT